MEKAFQAELVVISEEVRLAAIPNHCKETALWCLLQLPGLYAKFGAMRESRYSDEIARLIRGVIEELEGPKGNPETQKLALRIGEHFRLLHEEQGLPALSLKPARAATTRSRKTG